MRPTVLIRQIILAVGDVLVLYLALTLTLIIRYRQLPSGELIDIHLQPFTILFFFWILVFYISGLYELRRLKNNLEFFKNFGAALAVNVIIAILFFYIFTDYGLAPKTILAIFLIAVFFLEYLWRSFYNNFIGQRSGAAKILFLGNDETATQLITLINQHPQLGYKAELCDDLEDLSLAIVTRRIDILAIANELKKDPKLAAILYHYLTTGLEVVDSAIIYEIVFGKLPIAQLNSYWFSENLIHRHKIYDFFLVPIEILAAALLTIILSPLLLLIAIFIKLTSPGPVLIRQKRVGELGKIFILYKFRSMIANSPDGSAEMNTGAVWSGEADPRVTPFGKFLRHSHLDELPQLFNIVRGEVSFVGPRPERPDFVGQLKNKILFYELRHLVKPGITGWAQLNYRYGASVEDAYEKLQFDLYYLKNRSLWLDLGIIIKTIKLFFVKN